ncbi:flagellar basal body-associated FliL family protein [Scandinavium goeteborgense]|uniref:Flagellar protein FliL n=1 Tax=Scandinavium goeteborgense TaxID=1851514 RepID=A0A4V3BPM4_SCAGO|nr:flagellar basal body-associated FliL family protein [Scandinavium goeteborgense]TDN59427.1 flagellar FliL protein [Scandinavium goeteborgense]
MSNKNKKAASGGGSRSLLTTLMFLIAVTACGFAGYMFWEMKYAQPQNAIALEPQTSAAPVVSNVEPLYLPMSSFTVSLKPTANESDRVLYLGITVRVAERQSLTMLEKYLPEYRSRLFLLLTQQTYEGLSTDEGKTQFIASIKNELSKPLTHNQAIQPTDVLINEFILR